jgi:hypothetical protein
MHPLGQLAENREIERRRGDLWEIAWVGEKLPTFIKRDRKNLAALQNVNGHW